MLVQKPKRGRLVEGMSTEIVTGRTLKAHSQTHIQYFYNLREKHKIGYSVEWQPTVEQTRQMVMNDEPGSMSSRSNKFVRLIHLIHLPANPSAASDGGAWHTEKR